MSCPVCILCGDDHAAAAEAADALAGDFCGKAQMLTDTVEDLRAQLAAVDARCDANLARAVRAEHDLAATKADADRLIRERDELRHQHEYDLDAWNMQGLKLAMADQQLEDALARVAKLEAALAPTPENLNHYAGCTHDVSENRCIYHEDWARRIARIRERAGLDGEEG